MWWYTPWKMTIISINVMVYHLKNYYRNHECDGILLEKWPSSALMWWYITWKMTMVIMNVMLKCLEKISTITMNLLVYYLENEHHHHERGGILPGRWSSAFRMWCFNYREVTTWILIISKMSVVFELSGSWSSALWVYCLTTCMVIIGIRSAVFNYLDVDHQHYECGVQLHGGDHQHYECGVQLNWRWSSAIWVWCSTTGKTIFSFMCVVFDY